MKKKRSIILKYKRLCLTVTVWKSIKRNIRNFRSNIQMLKSYTSKLWKLIITVTVYFYESRRAYWQRAWTKMSRVPYAVQQTTLALLKKVIPHLRKMNLTKWNNVPIWRITSAEKLPIKQVKKRMNVKKLKIQLKPHLKIWILKLKIQSKKLRKISKMSLQMQKNSLKLLKNAIQKELNVN